MRILHFIMPCLFLMYQELNAKVVAPNYTFETKLLNVFFPGAQLTDLEKKYPKSERLGSKFGLEKRKFLLKHPRYEVTVLTQSREGEVLDVFVRLPSYFLHDTFLADLVVLHGKQTGFKRLGEEASYVWEKDRLKLAYYGSCTIVCFPVYFTAFYRDAAERGFTPMLEEMRVPAQR